MRFSGHFPFQFQIFGSSVNAKAQGKNVKPKGSICKITIIVRLCMPSIPNPRPTELKGSPADLAKLLAGIPKIVTVTGRANSGCLPIGCHHAQNLHGIIASGLIALNQEIRASDRLS